MTEIKMHTIESAKKNSKAILTQLKKANGMIAGLHAVMTEAPGLLKARRNNHELFLNSSFDNNEITVVWQTINVEHSCHYCVPVHITIAKNMKISDEISDALRN